MNIKITQLEPGMVITEVQYPDSCRPWVNRKGMTVVGKHRPAGSRYWVVEYQTPDNHPGALKVTLDDTLVVRGD